MSSSRVSELVLAGRASEFLGTAARTWPRLRRATGPYLSPLPFDLRGMALIWKSRICRGAEPAGALVSSSVGT